MIHQLSTTSFLRTSIPRRALMSTTALKYLLVLDFEANCGDGISTKKKNQEIIEWPTLLYNLEADELKATFHEYIKPVVVPQITEFCTELTGIEQPTVDAADDFKPVFKRFHEFLHQNGIWDGTSAVHPYAFVTCGEWDLKSMLPAQLDITSPGNHTEALAPFHPYINIKKAFGKHYNRTRPAGMSGMLQILKLKLEGRHHSGIDDCRNILRLVQQMRNDGWQPEI